MIKVHADRLIPLVQQIFSRAGCQAPEDAQIARRLVESNLVGHDSHGVIRVAYYIDWLKKDMVRANQKVQTVFETDTLAVLDGQRGFGQSVGEQALDIAIAKAKKSALSILALRNTAHLGRIGDWPQMACDAGLCSLFFVNTSGFGLLVAPWGGIDRRLSANPVAAGVPVPGGTDIIYDISTSSIAEGKLKVAFNKGVDVPPGCIIDHDGNPTNDPKTFYGKPPGAILPFGGYKGYGLGIIAEMFAGALTGSGCSDPAAPYLINGMFALLIDPERIPNDIGFGQEVERFIAFVKQSRKATPESEILMPGEIEARTKRQRLAEGIELDDITWKSLCDCAQSLGVAVSI